MGRDQGLEPCLHAQLQRAHLTNPYKMSGFAGLKMRSNGNFCVRMGVTPSRSLGISVFPQGDEHMAEAFSAAVPKYIVQCKHAQKFTRMHVGREAGVEVVPWAGGCRVAGPEARPRPDAPRSSCPARPLEFDPGRVHARGAAGHSCRHALARQSIGALFWLPTLERSAALILQPISFSLGPLGGDPVRQNGAHQSFPEPGCTPCQLRRTVAGLPTGRCAASSRTRARRCSGLHVGPGQQPCGSLPDKGIPRGVSGAAMG